MRWNSNSYEYNGEKAMHDRCRSRHQHSVGRWRQVGCLLVVPGVCVFSLSHAAVVPAS